jgi:RHH-type rel operon transcriptional repressor/antitoxin RelB
MLTLDLPLEIERRLVAFAKANGRSVSEVASEAIVELLEDFEDLALAERELIEVRAGRSDTASLEQVMGQYGLAD